MKYLANEVFYFVFNCVSLNHGKPSMQYGEPVPQAKTFIISLDMLMIFTIVLISLTSDMNLQQTQWKGNYSE